MIKKNDFVGQKFGKLTVVKVYGRSGDRHLLWECLCDCGNKTVVLGKDLRNGHTRSCGCLQKEVIAKIRTKHGDRDARLYRVWRHMKQRCENPRDGAYRWYGAKGVSVCEEWHDYTAFKAWALKNGYDARAKYSECTIDRINPYGNYEPSNCRWVDMKTQAKNKRKDMRPKEEENA